MERGKWRDEPRVQREKGGVKWKHKNKKEKWRREVERINGRWRGETRKEIEEEEKVESKEVEGME